MQFDNIMLHNKCKWKHTQMSLVSIILMQIKLFCFYCFFPCFVGFQISPITVGVNTFLKDMTERVISYLTHNKHMVTKSAALYKVMGVARQFPVHLFQVQTVKIVIPIQMHSRFVLLPDFYSAVTPSLSFGIS